MKNIGSHFEYEEARNKDLIRAYREQTALSPNLSKDDIYKLVVNMPSERFWVSEERAAIVVSKMMRGGILDLKHPTKREMFLEIFHRVQKAKKQNPEESIYNLTFDVVNSPAPKFYMTPGSAKVIIYKIRKEWYRQRKLKYRHLFM